MRELSLHLLDIVQNSISAGATLIEIGAAVHEADDTLTITVKDNGRGMTPEQVERVKSPFFTTRTTRKVGLGIPLFLMAAEQTGGSLSITSDTSPEHHGTRLSAVFGYSHIDRMPVGDICGTMTVLIRMNPQLDFVYRESVAAGDFTLDTRDLREILGGVSLSEPEVMDWITAYFKENSRL